MKVFFVFILCFSLLRPGLAQDSLNGRALFVGSSFTYIWDYGTGSGVAPDRVSYQEYTWQINANWQWHPRWTTGINYLNVVGRSLGQGRSRAFLAGLFQQYAFYREGRWRFFGETGFYTGNHCTCGDADPYVKDGLTYLSLGAGGHYALGRRLRLDLAFHTYGILNRVPAKYNYTQYVIGLDYRLSR